MNNSGEVAAARKLEILRRLNEHGTWATAGEVGGRCSSWHSRILLTLSAAGAVEKEQRAGERFGFFNVYKITALGKTLINGKDHPLECEK